MTEARESNEQRHASRWPLAAAVLVCAIAVAGAVVWGLWSHEPDGRARHVIVISLDTTRVGFVGCYGNQLVRTPRIDQLATESFLFTDYMTVASTTLASHTSLFTGKYPHSHGVPRNGFVANDDNVMLTEVLKEAGFHTAGFLGSFALDKRFNFAQGFEHYDQQFDILANAQGVDQNQRRADAVTDAVIDYLDREGVPRHLFLFVHYFDPHSPYDPLPPYDQMYAHTEGLLPGDDSPVETDGTDAAPTRRADLYAGEISYMDHHVGRLLDDLKARGILDKALLIVTSDHGENLGDVAHSRPGHGWSTYQIEVGAVCMMRLPGAQRGGTRSDAPVASIDVVPTVLSHLGLPAPPELEGQPINLEQPSTQATTRTRFGEATKPWQNVERDPRWFNNLKPRCVREGPFKYIQTVYKRTEELYDLASDPHERTNLLAAPTPEAKARATELRRKLQAWTASAKPLPTHFDNSQKEETIRRLRALGYLGEEDEEDEGGEAGETPP